MPLCTASRVAATALAAGTYACAPPISATVERWPEADALFHQEPRWLGGDGAYSIDLGGDRTLWLFGDSFIATSPALVRTESILVRNSIAVMTGRDPRTAHMQLAWRGEPPASFFPEAGDHWFWPSGGVRLPGGAVLVFLSELRPDSGGLGFAASGWRAVRIPDISGPPAGWTLEPLDGPDTPFDPDAAVGACVATDGAHLVAVAVSGSTHDGRLARWPLAALAAGPLPPPQWWDGSAWTATGTPAVVLPDGATECSLAQRADGTWIHAASRGFGATTIALRAAAAPEGPYTPPVDVFTPPESLVSDAFVYAGKGHAQLDAGAADGFELVLTYADNSFTFEDLFDPAKADTLYWPHVARLAFE